ncbi:hypothetical protein D3C87_1871990 [compost metagenome]
MVEEIGAFLDQLGPVMGHGSDHRFGGFLAQLLGRLVDAPGDQLCGVAFFGRGSGALGDARFEIFKGHGLGRLLILVVIPALSRDPS